MGRRRRLPPIAPSRTPASIHPVSGSRRADRADVDRTSIRMTDRSGSTGNAWARWPRRDLSFSRVAFVRGRARLHPAGPGRQRNHRCVQRQRRAPPPSTPASTESTVPVAW